LSNLQAGHFEHPAHSQIPPLIDQEKNPQKEKQSAYASALLWSSPDTVIFPCGSLIFGIEPGPKRCTRIRELINVLLRKQDQCQMRMQNYFSNISSMLPENYSN
jgi:hypothetical protein